MRVEKIEKSKHRQERILVYLEEGNLLRITESELLHFGLYVGLDISEETVIELRAAGKRSETRVRAANMIGARPLSKKELQKRLREKGTDEKDAASASDWLESIGALDDRAYAAMLARHYSAAGYGEARVRDELYRRGVPKDLWETALADMPDASAVIDRLIARKKRGALDEKEKKKLSDMLLRRGFSWHDVKAALIRMGETIDEGD